MAKIIIKVHNLINNQKHANKRKKITKQYHHLPARFEKLYKCDHFFVGENE